MLKRVVSVMITLVLLLFVAGAAVAASASENLQIQPDTAVKPIGPVVRYFMPGGISITAKITKSGNTVNAIGLYSVPPTYSARLTVCLQRKYGSNWVTIRSSSGSPEACASATITPGVYYRAHVVCYVTDPNGEKNTYTKDSPSKTY